MAVKDSLSESLHRTSIKEATNVKYFKKAESFYWLNFYLLKNSGPLKASLKQTCEALGITYYNLPECHGTQFVNHRKCGFSKFIHLWPAFITTYQDASITTPNAKTRAKILGLLKKFTDVRELLQVEVFLDILELVSVSSLVLEKKIFYHVKYQRPWKLHFQKLIVLLWRQRGKQLEIPYHNSIGERKM